MGFSRVFANPASKAHGNPNSLSLNCHVLLVGEKSPSPLVQNPVGILHLKAVASLRLHRYACACGKEKTIAK